MNALSMGARIAAVRGCITRVQETRARFRALDADPNTPPNQKEQARYVWRAWERELGSKADELLAILDYFGAAQEDVPRRPITAEPFRDRAERLAKQKALGAGGGA